VNDGGGFRNPGDVRRSSYLGDGRMVFVTCSTQPARVLLAFFWTAFSTTPLEAKVASPAQPTGWRIEREDDLALDQLSGPQPRVPDL
jgi:hypothetical protein